MGHYGEHGKGAETIEARTITKPKRLLRNRRRRNGNRPQASSGHFAPVEYTCYVRQPNSGTGLLAERNRKASP